VSIFELLKEKSKLLIAGIVLSLCGLVWIQTHLLKRAFDQSEISFDRNVKVAMQNVSNSFFVQNVKDGINEIVDTTFGDSRQIHIELHGQSEKGHGVYTTNFDKKITILHDGDSHFKESFRRSKIVKFSDDSLMNKDAVEWANVLVKELIRGEGNSHWSEEIKTYDFESVIRSQITALGLPERFEFEVRNENGETLNGSSSFDTLGKVYEKSLLYGDVFPSGTLYLKIGQRNYSIFSTILMPITLSVAFLLLAALLFIYIFGLYRKQKSVSEARDDFINSMSHELKTPLATISLSLENLNLTGRENKNYASIIKEENLRMQYYVENILQLARLDHTEFVMEKKPVNICELMRSVIGKESVQVHQQQGEITFTGPEEITVELDVLHMGNVLYNIIDNAIQYNDNSPIIHVNASVTNGGIQISIEDNGRGIDTKNQVKIFEKFYRVQTGNIYGSKGTGIGLSYVKQIIELHGGNVRVVSSIGKGSTFIIHIPLEQ